MGFHSKQGLTLIEIVVVLAIVGIALVPLSAVFVTGIGHLNHTSLLVRATYLAQDLMEEVIAEAPAALTVLALYEQNTPAPVGHDPRFSFTRLIREDTACGLIRLEVAVLWRDMGGQRAYRVVTLLAKAPL